MTKDLLYFNIRLKVITAEFNEINISKKATIFKTAEGYKKFEENRFVRRIFLQKNFYY